MTASPMLILWGLRLYLNRDPQLDPVVRRVYQVLFCPKIPFRRLNGRVPEEQLDLLQFPARGPAQLRAGATTVVGGDSGYSGGQRVRLEQLPNDLFRSGRRPAPGRPGSPVGICIPQ